METGTQTCSLTWCLFIRMTYPTRVALTRKFVVSLTSSDCEASPATGSLALGRFRQLSSLKTTSKLGMRNFRLLCWQSWYSTEPRPTVSHNGVLFQGRPSGWPVQKEGPVIFDKCSFGTSRGRLPLRSKHRVGRSIQQLSEALRLH